MTILEERDLEELPKIPEYYKGKTIFITGGTGFIGKVLIEKLIYSCSDLDSIYLLLRPKKGVKPEDRLTDIYASKCFDRLRKDRPGVFESKVYCIEGDCSELGLGMSQEDRALIINRAHIIYHAAASVRFDDPLKVSAKLNLRGTREIIDLAKDVKNLECFVHVSTSYANTNRDPIEEVIYPPHADWREMLEICENMDDHTLNILTPKYLGEMPNTYVFTKQLAEHVVYEQRGKLPIVIVRPSIVVSSLSEPTPGWIENFNGPIGLTIASGKGILRAVYGDPDLIADYIPVDIVVKGLIAASWMRGTQKVKPTDDIPVYNTCNGSMGYRITTNEIFLIGAKVVSTLPFDNIIRSLNVSYTTIKSIYFINNVEQASITEKLVSRVPFSQIENIIRNEHDYCSTSVVISTQQSSVKVPKACSSYKDEQNVEPANHNEKLVSRVPFSQIENIQGEPSTSDVLSAQETSVVVPKACASNTYKQVLLFHIVPAIFLDSLLWMFGRKKMLLKIQRRIYLSNLALQLFATQQWTFSNENFLSLRSKIKREDKEQFHYKMENIDRYQFLFNGVIGARRFLLNEKDENLPHARAHYKRIVLLEKIVKYLICGYIFWRIVNTDFVRNIYNNLVI